MVVVNGEHPPGRVVVVIYGVRTGPLTNNEIITVNFKRSARINFTASEPLLLVGKVAEPIGESIHG